MTITQVPVTGRFTNPDGTWASGQVVFELVTAIVLPGSRWVTNSKVSVHLVAGELPSGFTLDATDEDDVQPHGVRYRVTPVIRGARMPTFLLAVPHTAPSVDLSTAVPAASPEWPQIDGGSPAATGASLIDGGSA